jgi:hypothetical protein
MEEVINTLKTSLDRLPQVAKISILNAFEGLKNEIDRATNPDKMYQIVQKLYNMIPNLKTSIDALMRQDKSFIASNKNKQNDLLNSSVMAMGYSPRQMDVVINNIVYQPDSETRLQSNEQIKLPTLNTRAMRESLNGEERISSQRTQV